MTTRMIFRALLALLFGAALTGCAASPDGGVSAFGEQRHRVVYTDTVGVDVLAVSCDAEAATANLVVEAADGTRVACVESATSER